MRAGLRGDGVEGSDCYGASNSSVLPTLRGGGLVFVELHVPGSIRSVEAILNLQGACTASLAPAISHAARASAESTSVATTTISYLGDKQTW